MPTYCYRTMDGHLHELVMTIAEMERQQKSDGTIRFSDGRIAKRDFRAEFGNNPTNKTGWPMTSDAAGVHPTQIPEARAELKGKGVSADFTPDGRIIFNDRAHRRQCLRALGMRDRNAGYSD